MQRACEVLIVGSGITGLTIAPELLARGLEDILILEKENTVGAHASGRNSGVLHSGIYYTPDTFRARFCVEGNRLLKGYCRDFALVTLKIRIRWASLHSLFIGLAGGS